MQQDVSVMKFRFLPSETLHYLPSPLVSSDGTQPCDEQCFTADKRYRCRFDVAT